MAAGDVDSGFGVSVTFSSGAFAYIRNVEVSASRNSIDSTHAATTNGWKTYLPSDLKDMGELTGELLHKNTTNWKTALAAAKETVTVTFPNNGSSAQTIACDGFLTEWGAAITAAPDDDVITNNVTIKFTGEPTFTVGA